MILIATVNLELAKKLKKKLLQLGSKVTVISPKEKNFLAALGNQSLSSVVIDLVFGSLSLEVCVDTLNGIALRSSVVALHDDKLPPKQLLPAFSDNITLTPGSDFTGVLTALGMLGAINSGDFKSFCRNVPTYNIQIPVNLLRRYGGLGIISIDTACFGKIGLEYGIDVYSKVKDVFQSILFELWGKEGNFREDDILCRKSVASNLYYVFLSRSRKTGSLPFPGALEGVADRVLSTLQKSILEELSTRKPRRRIPECVQNIPVPHVGFIGILNNPCIETSEIIETGLDDARKVSVAQMKRLKGRQLELMQTLIQGEDFLVPHFQAVFRLRDITEEQVKTADSEGSIEPLSSHIFGFESLIRVNQKRSNELVKCEDLSITGLDAKFLRPDILFALAKSTKVSLELDQACLKQAAEYSFGLPGVLMVNILPRNLYYIDRLRTFFHSKSIMFEVSEAEAINNFELMKKSCAILEAHDMGIAADDFGKGFSSLERIIKIKPDVIKFDRSMVENIHEDPVKQAYVKGMVKAAEFIKTTILAEGVEKWEEAKVLQNMGIELIQGFLLHKPQAAHEILKDLQFEHKTGNLESAS